jgi:phytanoyl-CoA hydroxylase
MSCTDHLLWLSGSYQPRLELLVPLIGPAIRAQGDKLNIKPPAVGSPIEWHQDFAHYPHTNDDLCAVGIALDDSDVSNGCVCVVPRSHVGPVLDHHQDGHFIGAVSPTRDGLDLAAAVPLEMRAGSLSIHHSRMLHGSARNTSPRSRRVLFFQYAAVDAWPLSGVPDWAAFNAKILRGQPTFDFRLVAMSARTRMPDGPRSGGGIYELQKPLRDAVFAVRGPKL